MNHLSSERIAQLRELLAQRYDDLCATAAQERTMDRGTRLRDDIGEVGDAADESVSVVLFGIENARAHLHVAEIRHIHASLARIQEGTYGICMSCSDAISLDRLFVQRACMRCTRCQTIYEKQFNLPRS